GSEEDEESFGGSIKSMTDESTSIVGGSDSDGSCVATRHGALFVADSTASTFPSTRSSEGRSATTTSKGKESRKRRTKRGAKRSASPAVRTKEETLHLIKLRDEMINAKHQEATAHRLPCLLRLTQVLLLSKQNQDLRDGIDAVEKEMASLHDMIEARDDTAQKLKRDGERLRREIKRLRVEGEEQKGQDNAMVVAATQNSRLLKLLEQEELKREEVLKERDEALAQVSELKQRVRSSDERHAERTSGLEVKLIKAIGENLALRDKYSGTDQRIETLERELKASREQAVFDKETAKAELSTLRQRQYEILSQLQESSDQLQRTKDEAESKGEEIEVCRQQSAELEMRLRIVQSDLSSAEKAAREREVATDEAARLAEARLSTELSLSESLHNKVASMSRTILRLVERHKGLQEEVGKHQAGEARLRDQIERAGQRELRLRQRVVRLESSSAVEATHKRLHSALDTFNSQMTKPPLPAAPTGGNTAHSLVASFVGGGTTGGSGDALRRRRQLLSKYTALFRLVAGHHGGGSARRGLEELDLSDCGLDDADVDGVVDAVRSCACLTALNLSMNFIGDAGAASIAGALRQASCGLKRVDLRCNQMTMEGVRMLAKALEENDRRGVSHVYVHSEGRIDALGRKSDNALLVGWERRASSKETSDVLGSFFSIVVVDARDNMPRTAGKSRDPLPAASRGKSHFTLAMSIDDQQKRKGSVKPGRRNIGSVTVARQSQVRDFMTKVAYTSV
ncbi:unnamed protein product, partial [Scytosiphon promiscuus]